ncbi:hypothetical protein EMCRGX_G031265 [Ephydatia muelleri]
MMEGQLNNSVSQRKLYPRGTANLLSPGVSYHDVQAPPGWASWFHAIIPGAWQKPSLDIIWKKNGLKID